jgi:hypothetical protein
MLSLPTIPALLQGVVEVEHATAISREKGPGTCFLERVDLVAGHRRRNRRMLERKSATEATAFGFVSVHGDLNRRQLAQQGASVNMRAHLATGSTRGVQRDPHRRPLIGEPDPGNIEQELGEFENTVG